MVVYVLRSESTGRYYTGCTEDLENRLHEHNAGYMRILGLPQKQKKPLNNQRLSVLLEGITLN